MNEPRQESSPSPQGQTGQAGQQQDQFISGVDPSKLAPELQSVYKNFQAGFTRKTQEIAKERQELESQRQQLEQQSVVFREKAEMLDTLSNDPGFQQWLVDRNQGRQQAQPQQNLSMGDRLREVLGTFEGSDALAGALEILSDNILQAVDQRLNTQLGPVVQQAQQSRQVAEFQALRDWALQNNLEDPANYRESIEIYQRKYPAIGVRDAYNMVVGSRRTSLTTRPAIDRGNPPAAGTGQPAGQQQGAGMSADMESRNPVMPPGGTAVVGSGVASPKSVLDQALENAGLDKRKGESTGRRIEMVLEQVVNDINAKGGNISRDDVFGRGG